MLLGVLTLAPMVLAFVCERCEEVTGRRVGHGWETTVVDINRPLSELLETETSELRADAPETHVHNVLPEPDGVCDLSSLVARERGDAHLRHDLQESLAHSLLVVCGHLRAGPLHALRKVAVPTEFQQGFIGHVWADSIGAEREEKGVVRHLVSLAALDDEGHLEAHSLLDKALVDGAARQERGEVHAAVAYSAVRNDQHPATAEHRLNGLFAEAQKPFLEALNPISLRKGRIQSLEVPRAELTSAEERIHLLWQQAWLLKPKPPAMFRRRVREQVLLGTDPTSQRHNTRFADGVDRRVRHLREELVKEVEDRARLPRKARERGVVAHTAQGFLTRRPHGLEEQIQRLLCIPEGAERRHARWTVGALQLCCREDHALQFARDAHLAFLEPPMHGGRLRRKGAFVCRQVLQSQALFLNPLPIRPFTGEGTLQLVVVLDAARSEVRP
mmetsp:Transcript_111573/g.315061  ORF Transcript_111573/g.315061 Transcript_111573/m.315061 type:complete len:445 (-) Transcript_111573:1421-2755(-)